MNVRFIQRGCFKLTVADFANTLRLQEQMGTSLKDLYTKKVTLSVEISEWWHQDSIKD